MAYCDLKLFRVLRASGIDTKQEIRFLAPMRSGQISQLLPAAVTEMAYYLRHLYSQIAS